MWVDYEIIESVKRGNGLLGIFIYNVKDLNGRTDVKGANPFDSVRWDNGKGAPLSATYPTYDWVATMAARIVIVDRSHSQEGRPLMSP